MIVAREAPSKFYRKSFKMIVAREASSKFHRSIQKCSLRARLPPNFTEQASKTQSFTPKICMSSQAWASDEHEVTRGLSPTAVHKTYPAERRRATIFRSHSQQLFSAAILSSSSQQPFSAALLSSHPQLSSCCGQGLVVSYCHQLLSSCCCGQGLVVSYLIIILLWSGVGGQLCTRSLEGPFRNASGKH